MTGTVFLDVHGVTVRIDCASASQRAALLDDYGPFAVETPTAAPRLVLTVTGSFSAAASDGEAELVGVLGDRIRLGVDHIQVAGPRAADEIAYLAEVRPYLTSTLIGIIQRDRGGLDLHASAVTAPGGGAVVFVGAKKAGKSSMALAMVSRGWDYLSNEMTLLLPDRRQVTVASLPQGLGIAPGAQAWFARNVSELGVSAPATLPPGADLATRFAFEDGEKLIVSRGAIVSARRSAASFQEPLAAVFFPEPALRLAQPRTRRVDPDDAAVRLMENVEYFLKWGRGPSQPAAALLTRTSDLVRRAAAETPCYHLQWCDDHSLNADLVERTVAGESVEGGIHGD